MDIRSLSNRVRLDAMGIALSALCAVHCVLTIVVISSLGLAGGWLLAPELHWWGLAAATFMGGALAAPHGVEEAALTIIGVALVSLGHVLNLRSSSDHRHGIVLRERR